MGGGGGGSCTTHPGFGKKNGPEINFFCVMFDRLPSCFYVSRLGHFLAGNRRGTREQIVQFSFFCVIAGWYCTERTTFFFFLVSGEDLLCRTV